LNIIDLSIENQRKYQPTYTKTQIYGTNKPHLNTFEQMTIKQQLQQQQHSENTVVLMATMLQCVAG
jgi:flagellar basal body rod protein FlgB